MTYALPPPRPIVLIRGVSGTGKVYTAQARPLGAPLLSSDVLRAAMRHLISAPLTPHLHRSSFTVCTDAGSKLPTSIDHQTAALVPALQAAMEERALSEPPLVVEDVHLLPNLPVHLLEIPMAGVLMTAQSLSVDVERLQQRDRGTHGQSPAEPPTPYVNEIRTVAPVLMESARVQDSNGRAVLPWHEHTHVALSLLSIECLTGATSIPVKGLLGVREAWCQ